ncbi:MAG: sialate O-acetylesterase [Verrucomicrobiales bacterium]|jgi:sialate O-acetylesterase
MKKLLVAFLCFFAAITAQAALELPAVFGDHMVLQRGLANPIWGWGNPRSDVTIKFAGQEKTTKIDERGRWKLKLDPIAEANAEGQTIEIVSGRQQLLLKDVLIGDVWICSGQSNMEWRTTQALNPQEEVAAADYPQIRLFDVLGHTIAPSPKDKLNGNWALCSPATVGNFSAVGYFFGRELHAEGGVPIGLIGTNWGGTRVEPWTPPIGFRGVEELASMSKQVDAFDATTESGKTTWSAHIDALETWISENRTSLKAGEGVSAPPQTPGYTNQGQPTTIYNAMVAPLVGYGVRGAIWYQGESNGNEGEAYFHKLRALVEGWRTVWDQGDFPLYFYVVQLANFQTPQTTPAGGDGYAKIRDGQTRVLELPHTGLAVITDIGEANDIHPKNKQDVGKRLARWALRDIFKKDIVVSGPKFKGLEVKGGEARVSFDHVGGGLMPGKKVGLKPVAVAEQLNIDGGSGSTGVEGFAIAGEDKVWHWAKATIDGDSIVLTSSEVSVPVAVRYAWAGNPTRANLYNKDGLPGVPFRTDDW